MYGGGLWKEFGASSITTRALKIKFQQFPRSPDGSVSLNSHMVGPLGRSFSQCRPDFHMGLVTHRMAASFGNSLPTAAARRGGRRRRHHTWGSSGGLGLPSELQNPLAPPPLATFRRLLKSQSRNSCEKVKPLVKLKRCAKKELRAEAPGAVAVAQKHGAK